MNGDLILIGGIVGSAFLILNIIFLWLIFNMRRKTSAVSQWPLTQGKVTVSTLQSRRSSNNRGRVNYPVVHYTYKVEGRTYQGNTIAPGLQVGGSGAVGVIARYPLNSQVAVFYDPEKPSSAVLEKKAMIWMWFVFIVVDVMFFGFVPMIWVFSL